MGRPVLRPLARRQAPPTPEEMAQQLGTEVTKVKSALKIAKDAISLDTPIGDDGETFLGDFIEDHDRPGPHEVSITASLSECLNQVMSTLTPREAKVLKMRYGIDVDYDHTLEEVGKQFGVTRERIRQIEARALNKLRAAAKEENIELPEGILESELFGYRKGAFTGAEKNGKQGLFEIANNGTLFLDEIGELPLPLQVKLLRVLQENEIRPIGESKTRKIDVRVVAATAKNLEEEVRKGTFREDLYYRLNVLTIKLPPLKQRSEDIPLLCKHFILRFNNILNKDVDGLMPEAMAMLLDYQWPGNVRELENVLERAMVIADDSQILSEHLFLEPIRNGGIEQAPANFESLSLKKARKVVEKDLITRALLETGGNRTRAARLLEISHPSLLSKMKLYGIV